MKANSNILSLNEKRISEDAFLYVFNSIKDNLSTPQKSTAIPFLMKLAATLKFLGQGYQNQIDQNRLLAISHQPISSCIAEICDHQMYIRAVNGRFGGANHDSHIWSIRNERQFLIDKYQYGDKDTRILETSSIKRNNENERSEPCNINNNEGNLNYSNIAKNIRNTIRNNLQRNQ
ncbi:hypothetical protein DOY81_009309 [Sarcophaga bullata]|nr:hypothetical protein DOY81_009309 [Sarcophaga bullata]